MPNINRSALLPYPSSQIYSLINDVSSYPHYMDGCTAAEVIAEGEGFMEARLYLSKAGLQYSFTTRNQLNPPYDVEMVLVDGPFSQFNGYWNVKPLGGSACKVSLALDFTLQSKVLGAAAKTLFNSMADNLVDALVKRAQYIYR
jgi:ribosome-associated toxin RatA of RatAB toxin-antitoxin module